MISISSNGQKDEYDFHFKGNKITITGSMINFTYLIQLKMFLTVY